MAYVIYTEVKNPVILFAEVKDKYYADVDKWHFLRCDEFESKEHCKKSFENGGYLIKNIFTEQEYQDYKNKVAE